MKRIEREYLEGNRLVRSGWFCCGELVGKFRVDKTGSFFCWIMHLVFFVGIDRIVVLMGALFDSGLLWFERESR